MHTHHRQAHRDGRRVFHGPSPFERFPELAAQLAAKEELVRQLRALSVDGG